MRDCGACLARRRRDEDDLPRRSRRLLLSRVRRGVRIGGRFGPLVGRRGQRRGCRHGGWRRRVVDVSGRDAGVRRLVQVGRPGLLLRLRDDCDVQKWAVGPHPQCARVPASEPHGLRDEDVLGDAALRHAMLRWARSTLRAEACGRRRLPVRNPRGDMPGRNARMRVQSMHATRAVLRLLTIAGIRRNPIVTAREAERSPGRRKRHEVSWRLQARRKGQKGRSSSRCARSSASLYRLTQAVTARAVSMMSSAPRSSG